jgi:hypothetical protein
VASSALQVSLAAYQFENGRDQKTFSAAGDVIGVTEKEAGSTLRERIETVVLLRRALHLIGSDIPIHLFGGLDPALSPLFFLARRTSSTD